MKSPIHQLFAIAMVLYLSAGAVKNARGEQLPLISINHAAKKYDMVAIGEPIVDIIVKVSKEELSGKLMKSATTRLDVDALNKILTTKSRDEYKVIPGGSEANAMVAFASLGGKAAFNGVLKDDEYGRLFKASLKNEGVDYLSHFAAENTVHSTARCVTFITPEDRTFAVAADITEEIDDSFVDYDAIANSKMFYTDASNVNGGGSKSKVTIKALDTAKNNSVITVFNLGNNNFVNKHRDEIISLLPRIDIIVGGEKEFKNLFQIKKLDKVIKRCLQHAKIAVITRGEYGAVIATKDEIQHVPTVVDKKKMVNVIGAGDGFIGGFLYGLVNDYTLEKSGIIGAETAAQIIYQEGGRPNGSLKKVLDLSKDKGKNNQ